MSEIFLFLLPVSVVEYMPNFFFGSLLMLFGVEITLDWLFHSYHKVRSPPPAFLPAPRTLCAASTPLVPPAELQAHLVLPPCKPLRTRFCKGTAVAQVFRRCCLFANERVYPLQQSLWWDPCAC